MKSWFKITLKDGTIKRLEGRHNSISLQIAYGDYDFNLNDVAKVERINEHI